jgi:hypothetical protein
MRVLTGMLMGRSRKPGKVRGDRNRRRRRTTSSARNRRPWRRCVALQVDSLYEDDPGDEVELLMVLMRQGGVGSGDAMVSS